MKEVSVTWVHPRSSNERARLQCGLIDIGVINDMIEEFLREVAVITSHYFEKEGMIWALF